MKYFILQLALVITVTINAQIYPSDGCSGAPELTMSTTNSCSTESYELPGAYMNTGLVWGSCFSGPDRDDGWFTFVATDVNALITVSGDQVFSCSVFTSCDFSTEVGCNYCSTPGIIEVPANPLTIGNLYYIQIHRESGTATTNMIGEICIGPNCTFDNTAPTGTAPANLSVECASDVPAADPLLITDEADNCDTNPIVTFISDVSDNNTNPEVITRTYRITDASSNFLDVQQLITIQDTEAPTATGPTSIVVACNQQIPSPDINVVQNVSDNCSSNPTVAFFSDVSDNQTSPETITRTYSITDDAGNSSSVTQIITVTSPQCTASSCLLAEYLFNGNADDGSGNGNHGTVNGASLATDRFGNVNSAYQFNGVDNNIQLPNFLSGNEVTISVWVYVENSANTQNPILGISDNTVTQNLVNFSLSKVSSDSLTSTIVHDNRSCGGDQKFLESDTILGYNKWIHLVYSIDQTSSLMYLNGQLLTDTSQQGLIMGKWLSDLCSSPNTFTIGSRIRLGDAKYFKGKIDDVKFYQCVLGETAIQAMYDAEAPAITCGFTVGQSVTQPTCNNSTNGAIDLLVAGGQAPISYSWSNGSTTQDISGLQPGQYSVIITDANGCDTSRSFTIPPANVVSFTMSLTNATCNNADGSALVNVNQGTSPFEFSYTSGDTLSLADDLDAGMYSVTVTDANGCSASKVFVISDTDGPSLSAITIEPTCPDDTDGGVNLSVTGGATPYTFEWSNGESSEDISSLGAGIYDVEVTDANGCVAMDSYELTGGTQIDLTDYTMTNPTCGNPDGEIAVNVTGGSGVYAYQWSANTGGQNTATATSLSAGAYYLSVIDNNGCTASKGYMLANISGPVAQAQTIYPEPCNGSGGGVNVVMTSGVPPFDYLWSNGATTQDLSGVTAGVYDLQVTDDNGCSDMITVEITKQTPDVQEICVVTVDSLTQTNLVAWEKPAVADGIAYYNIYREGNQAGVYTLMDTVRYNSLSQWTDPGADPTVRGWRYKISVVDSCGAESALSTYHKSVHLTINQGVGNVINLIWDDYIGATFPSWIIERYHNTTGWITIDTIPSNLGSYTDANPPTNTGNLNYAVYGEPTGGCTSTRAQDHNSTRSNKSTISAPVDGSGISEWSNYHLGVYPNPVQDNWVNITTDYRGNYRCELIDARGKIVHSFTEYGDVTLNLENISKGMYFLKFSILEDVKIVKLIVD